MRIIDLHCYPGTQVWIDAQGPYVEALAKYWSRGWVAKTEDEVTRELADAGVQACLVALDLETTIATPPCTNEYVHEVWKRHPDRILQCWGTLDPFKGRLAIEQAKKADRGLVERLLSNPPAQKVVMYHPSLDEAWRLSQAIARKGAARELFGNYSYFDPIASA